MRRRFKARNLFSLLGARSKNEQYLAQYVVREFGRGRPLRSILDDTYVRNRTTPEERARLLERPEIVAAIGERAVADLKLSVTAARE